MFPLSATVIVVFLLAGGRGQAATLSVPSASYPTIQSAINGAANGDTIVVAAGTYPESITWSTKSLTLQGAGAGQTIVDPSAAAGGPGGRCMALTGVPPTANIEGFAFQNGSASEGGGMYNSSSSPTIMNCAFSGNSAPSLNGATTYGGGMYNSSSSPTVTNCAFSGNSAFDGGGMFDNVGSSPAVSRCTFSGNSAAAGGGMFNDGSPTVTNCACSGNTATFGGGMLNNGGSPTVTNCLFSGNSAYEGGGIRNDSSSSATVTNSSFSGNTATHYGGGVDNRFSSNPTITNCTLWGDTGAEIYNETTTGVPTSSPTVTYSDVQGGYSGTGNINADPLFVRSPFTNGSTDYGDLRLLPGSPCIDAGNNAVVTSPPFLTDSSGTIIDLDGNPRIDGAAVDMGAYEFQRAPTITSVSPGSATPGTLLYVYGTNLATTSSVTFNGVKAHFQTANDGLVWTYVPNSAPFGSDIIQITTAAGSVTTPFTVLAPPAPAITSVRPGSATPGTLLYVYGTNLATTSSVTFNGVKAYFQTANDGLVWTYVPNSAPPGSSTIQVTTAKGSATAPFTVLAPPAPTITSVSPTSGSAGTFVTIQGTAFATTHSVTFNGVKAYFQTANDDLLWVYVPRGAAGGAGGLVVTNATGSAATAFTVTP